MEEARAIDTLDKNGGARGGCINERDRNRQEVNGQVRNSPRAAVPKAF